VCLQTGWLNFFSNFLFWALVLGAKFAFDWFALMKPLKRPVEGLWGRDWLSAGKNDGDFVLVIARCAPSFIVMFNDAQVGGLGAGVGGRVGWVGGVGGECVNAWVNGGRDGKINSSKVKSRRLQLCRAARLHTLPTLLQVFYYIIMAFFGSLKGIVQLNLGSISTFQEVVVSFHKAPKRWWEACTSAKGKSNLFRWARPSGVWHTGSTWAVLYRCSTIPGCQEACK
jgi:hypothetical protein